MSYRSSRIGTLLLILAIVSLIAVGTMMFGARLGLWEPIVGFGYIRKGLACQFNRARAFGTNDLRHGQANKARTTDP